MTSKASLILGLLLVLATGVNAQSQQEQLNTAIQSQDWEKALSILEVEMRETTTFQECLPYAKYYREIAKRLENEGDISLVEGPDDNYPFAGRKPSCIDPLFHGEPMSQSEAKRIASDLIEQYNNKFRLLLEPGIELEGTIPLELGKKCREDAFDTLLKDAPSGGSVITTTYRELAYGATSDNMLVIQGQITQNSITSEYTCLAKLAPGELPTKVSWIPRVISFSRMPEDGKVSG